MKADSPLVCNMNVFSTAQQEAHVQNTIHLIRSARQVRAIEDGYEFSFPNDTRMLSSITEFISNERLCCPFLVFTLKVSSNREPVSLALTGPTGTQDFLRAEFDGAFS